MIRPGNPADEMVCAEKAEKAADAGSSTAVLRLVLEFLATDPVKMRCRPRSLAVKALAVTQQERRQLITSRRSSSFGAS